MKQNPFKEVRTNDEGAPEVSPQEVQLNQSAVKIIDVRRPDEFTGELGHIEGAELCTLETSLEQQLPQLDKNQIYVFVCRSGARSSRATLMAKSLGIENSFNMFGGMIRWNALGFQIKK